jgi:hypothetical protein
MGEKRRRKERIERRGEGRDCESWVEEYCRDLTGVVSAAKSVRL